MRPLFIALWFGLSTAAHAQVVPTLDDAMTIAETQLAWQNFHDRAARGRRVIFEGGFKLTIDISEEGIIWELEGPDGSIVGAGEALGAHYNGTPPEQAMPVLFACVNGEWVPWVRLPDGHWLCLDQWITEPRWDFTFDCDPNEGLGPLVTESSDR